MEKTIENYRGVDICFDTDKERFTYSFDDISYGTKQSYSACKKSIDDYLKENSTFKPFKARSLNDFKIIDIVGIRKDGRFVFDKSGIKTQLSNWDEKYYVVYNEDDEETIQKIIDIDKQIRDLKVLRDKKMNEIKSDNLRTISENFNK